MTTPLVWAKVAPDLALVVVQVVPPPSSSPFFASTLPAMAGLALRLPAALQAQQAAALQAHPCGQHAPLHILRAHQPGLVLLTQVRPGNPKEALAGSRHGRLVHLLLIPWSLCTECGLVAVALRWGCVADRGVAWCRS